MTHPHNLITELQHMARNAMATCCDNEQKIYWSSETCRGVLDTLIATAVTRTEQIAGKHIDLYLGIEEALKALET